MGDFLSNIEGWFTRPVTSDLSPRMLALITVLVVIVVIATMDGVSILKKGLS